MASTLSIASCSHETEEASCSEAKNRIFGEYEFYISPRIVMKHWNALHFRRVRRIRLYCSSGTSHASTYHQSENPCALVPEPTELPSRELLMKSAHSYLLAAKQVIRRCIHQLRSFETAMLIVTCESSRMKVPEIL